MGPKIETCGELLHSLRVLLGIKQIALQHGQLTLTDQLPYAVISLLTELVARGECRASDLAHQRFVDASVISRQVAQLEQAGLLTRRPDPDDRRVSLLRATAEGERTVSELEQRKSGWLSDALADWDDRDVRQLAELLTAAMRDVRKRSFPQASELPDVQATCARVARRPEQATDGKTDADGLRSTGVEPDSAAGAEPFARGAADGADSEHTKGT